MNAQKRTFSHNPGKFHYSVGKFFCATITEEEYNEILSHYNNTPTQLSDTSEIIYMRVSSGIPQELMNKYAQKVLDRHSDAISEEVMNEKKELERKLRRINDNIAHYNYIKEEIK